MAWLSITLELDPAQAEALSETLIEAGADSVALEPASAGTRLTALAALDADPAALVASAARSVNVTLPAFSVTRLEDADWVRRSQSQFGPIRAGERLWIVPSWHEPPDPAAIVLRLDPGLAFGTGSHPTTRLCLEWLEQTVQGGEVVLDYGCGSGILAIAALALGAGRALGVDLDTRALEAARANCAVNAVHCDFADAAAPITIKADLVVANILANPLRLLAPALAGYTRPGGRLALAGILAQQADELRGIYQPWFDLDPVVEMDGWARISGKRRASPC